MDRSPPAGRALDEGAKDVSGFIRSFSGGHRDVFDFLAEEVLERQNEQVQAFLLETSVLYSLSGPLCDALTGRNDGQHTLEGWRGRTYWSFRWTTSGSGTVTITSSPSSCEVASSERRERLAPLHLKASGWYEENGLVAEAVRHSLSAGDHERAARLVERGTAQTWYRGEVVTLLGWLRALPEEAMRSRPLLLVCTLRR